VRDRLGAGAVVAGRKRAEEAELIAVLSSKGVGSAPAGGACVASGALAAASKTNVPGHTQNMSIA
jgi:hypothetical protein